MHTAERDLRGTNRPFQILPTSRVAKQTLISRSLFRSGRTFHREITWGLIIARSLAPLPPTIGLHFPLLALFIIRGTFLFPLINADDPSVITRPRGEFLLWFGNDEGRSQLSSYISSAKKTGLQLF
jgi:hypothetical protein